MKKITFIFALLCASVMGWATQYCHQAMTLSGNATIYLSCTSPSAGNYQIVIEGENLNGLGGSFFNPGTVDLRTTITSSTSTRIVCDIAAESAPSLYTPLYVMCPGEQNIGWPNDVEWGECAGGDPDPGSDPGETPVPDPNEYTAGGHTIHLEAYYVNDIYTLNITSTDNMEGLGGSFWNVNGVGTDMRSNSGTNSYTVSGDKKTITCQVQSSSAPNIYTPLYVLMPGEINFGSVTLNWEDRTPITSEYCNYQGSETQQDGHYYAITWETDPSGNVVITIGNGTGAGACSFRNGGFEGGNNGLANFVVSDDDFATTTPATDYFTVTRPSDGDLEYVMTKIADLPANAKIRHLTSGAIAWREAGADRWCWPEFTYTYGGTCNQLDAPTNVAIDANNILTFDAVAGADSYMAYVSLGGVEKYSQAVASGDELTYTALVTGDYIINVVASGAGKTDSDPSADLVWHLEAAPVVLGNSEYCEHVFMADDNREAAFTWETDGDGNIVITISATRGDAAATHFRGNGMALANFKVGAGKADASTYFNHACGGSNQVTLSLKNPANAPALGEKIYFNQTVEYATSLDGNAWPTLDFEWTYGTECSGFAVSATPNNNEMGTAVVQKAGVDVTNVEDGDEVSFIATVADAEQYRFVNWTKGGVEVSTNATYVTTITETTNLIANFEYIRNIYCHTEINSVQNKKLYLTLGAIGGGQYQIKIEGSAEAQLTGLNNANYTINWVTTDIVDGDKKMSGQDVPFNNARWAFDASGYGSATAVFGISEGKTWEDINVWNHAIYFSTAAGEVGYTGFPGRHNIDWNSTCSDAEAPVFYKAEAEVLNETSVQLKIQATDNWGGLLTYTIAREAAEPIISNHASGEEFTQDVTGLTTGTEYTFTVTVSDGVNNANQNIVVTPVGDSEKPVMTSASLESKTWNSAIINVAAMDNKGVTAYYVVEKDADYVATEGKITIEGLTANTDYALHIKAKDAAGNISDNQAEVNFTTDTHLLAPTTAPAAPTWPAGQVISFYSDTYTAPNTWNFRAPWGGSTVYEQVVIEGNNIIHYSTLDYVGWIYEAGGTPYNAINMEKLHLDIWVADDCTIGIVPIYGGDGLTTDDNKRKKPALTGQQWNSIDLDLATDYAGLNLASIFQFKFDQATTTEFWVDNVYFYRTTELVDNEAPTNVTASVAETGFYSVKITAQAEDNMGSVNFSVMNGAVEVATGASVSGVPTTITVSNLTPGTAYDFTIIAKDDKPNEAAPVVVAATTKTIPAPAPAPDFGNKKVVAVFTDAMACAVSGIQSGGWGETTQVEWLDIAEGDKVFYAQNFNWAGWHSWGGGNIDATGMQYLHVDIYSTGMTAVSVTPISPGHEGSATINLTPNDWTSYDVPLSAYDANNIDWEHIFQFKFMNPVDGNELLIDNVYFYRDPDYSRDGLTVGNYGTICLPQAGDIVGATLYEIADYANNMIYVDEVEGGVMEAGKPYIFQATSDKLNVYYTSATVEETAGSANGLHGFYNLENENAQFNIPVDAGNYILYQNQYWLVSGRAAYINNYRAYIKIDEINYTAPSPSRRRVAMTVNGEQTATGMDAINATDAPVKMVINGQLFILRGEKMYDTTGRLVK